MSESVDYLVIGAGAVGSAAALELSRQGKKVVLLEQFELGHDRGSSHGESRIIRYAYEHPLYVRMAKESYPLWRAIEQEANQPLYLKTGGIDLGPLESPELVACADSLSQENIPFQVWNAEDIRKRFPQFNIDDSTYGLYQEATGILPPSLSVATMHDLCRRYGAEIRSSYPVESLDLEQSTVRVKSGSSVLLAKNVVLCAGSWIGPLLARLGLQLPLSVSQEQYAFFLPKVSDDFLPGRFPVFLKREIGVASGGISLYGFPIYGRAGVKAAIHQSGVATTADARDFQVEPKRLARLKSAVESLLPEAAGEILHSATCLYTNTPDQDFVIDRLSVDANVVFFTGCSGHAFKFAPFLGKLLVEMLEGSKTTIPTAMFSAGRFAKLAV